MNAVRILWDHIKKSKAFDLSVTTTRNLKSLMQEMLLYEEIDLTWYGFFVIPTVKSMWYIKEKKEYVYQIKDMYMWK